MLSLRDVIDFAAMSEDLAQELNNPKVGLPDLGAVVAGHNGRPVGTIRGCNSAPCSANDLDGE